MKKRFRSRTSNKFHQGFTLIELIITIAIIGILALLGMRGYMEGIKRAKVARAQADLNRIGKALRQLEMDTGYSANHEPADDTCSVSAFNENEFYIHTSDLRSGIYSATYNGGTYANWKGKYLDEALIDPWGRRYIYDGDYFCQDNELSKKAKGCEDYQDLEPTRHQRVIFSQGHKFLPGVESLDTKEVYDDDNVVLVLCVEP